MFLSRHPFDNRLCDDTSRWWPLQYEYVLDTNNIPGYGARILLGPNRKPNTKKYILWTTSVPLSDLSCYIHEPFNFDSRSDIIKPNQYIVLRNWVFLLASCFTLSIVPHNLSILTIPNISQFPKGNGTRPSKRDRIYTTSILVLLFIVK